MHELPNYVILLPDRFCALVGGFNFESEQPMVGCTATFRSRSGIGRLNAK